MFELLLPHLPEIIALILGLIGMFAVKKKWMSESTANKLQLDVSGAVTSVYHEYVKARKAAAEDGKLTDDEAKVARQLALAKLADIGKTKGIDYAKTYGIPAIVALIEKYVQKHKK